MSEPIRYAVWEVRGYDDKGNISLIETYHFADKALATEHANRIKAGYVLAARVFVNASRKALPKPSAPVATAASDANPPVVVSSHYVSYNGIAEEPHLTAYPDGKFGRKVAEQMALNVMASTRGSLTRTDKNGKTTYTVIYGSPVPDTTYIVTVE